jgi:hypothetical protein
MICSTDWPAYKLPAKLLTTVATTASGMVKSNRTSNGTYCKPLQGRQKLTPTQDVNVVDTVISKFVEARRIETSTDRSSVTSRNRSATDVYSEAGHARAIGRLETR